MSREVSAADPTGIQREAENGVRKAGSRPARCFTARELGSSCSAVARSRCG
jgi:hypothetical protein